MSQVVVVGDGRPFIGALVTLDEDMLPGWLTNHGLPMMNVEQAAADERVLAALDRAVTRANEAVSRAESIRKISVLTTDFTMGNGYLTPSQKVRRATVTTDFAAEIDAIYGTCPLLPASLPPLPAYVGKASSDGRVRRRFSDICGWGVGVSRRGGTRPSRRGGG